MNATNGKPEDAKVAANAVPSLTKEQIETQNESAIARIVDSIKVNLRSAGERNFGVGAEVLGHARWQQGNFAGKYVKEDFKRLCDRIADKVRIDFELEANKVSDYARSAAFLEASSTVVGDSVSILPYGIVADVVSRRVLSFDHSTLVAEIKPEWVEWLKSLCLTQASSSPISPKAVRESADAHQASLDEAKKTGMTPEALAKALQGKATAAQTAKRNRANTTLTTVVSEILSEGIFTPSGMLAIVETVAKSQNVALPTSGLNPADCKPSEARAFIRAMFNAGLMDCVRAAKDEIFNCLAEEKERRTKSAKVASVTSSVDAQLASVA